MTVLITGAAGFIGANLALRLLQDCPDVQVIGLDCVNDYYDTRLKRHRLERLGRFPHFRFIQGSLENKELLLKLFQDNHPQIVVNLAGQAGVRYSIVNPDAYIESNVVGFFHVLEACRRYPVEHLVYASSSSVYGSGSQVPYCVEEKADCPVSLYAATKRSDELLAYAYAKLYNIPTTGLRFFTVYGPAGRPDMAYFSFTEKLRAGKTIEIFNYGHCSRDFTYIDDIVEGILRVMRRPPNRQNGADGLPIAPHALYNIGSGNPQSLTDFVEILAQELTAAGVLPPNFDLEAHRKLVPMQPGDVAVTYADTAPLERDFGFRPSTPLREGLRAFALWYRSFYMEE